MVSGKDRSLTDADIEAIIDGLEERLVTRFYGEVGKGVWHQARKLLWSLLLAAMLALAAHGAGVDRAMLHDIGT